MVSSTSASPIGSMSPDNDDDYDYQVDNGFVIPAGGVASGDKDMTDEKKNQTLLMKKTVMTTQHCQFQRPAKEDWKMMILMTKEQKEEKKSNNKGRSVSTLSKMP